MPTLLLLLACPKPISETGPPEPGPAPVLPAPYAPVYTQAPGTPADPLVRWVIGEATYDEALSGAAGSLALLHAKTGALDEAAIRWALITAGWPHGVHGFEVFNSDYDQVPDALRAALAQVPAGRPVGLVRARTAAGDSWFLLHGDVSVAVQPFSREADLGEVVDLTTGVTGWTGLTQRALSPSGRVFTGPVAYGEPGEWLLELSGTDPYGQPSTPIQVPVYVAEVTPEDGPFLAIESDKVGTTEAARRAEYGLGALRDLLDAPPMDPDPVLVSLARQDASSQVQGFLPPDPRTAGFERIERISCVGASVQGCLDQVFWDIDGRQVLQDPTWDLVGAAAEWTPAGLMVVAYVADG